MGNPLSIEPKRDDANAAISIETNVILRDVMFHLHSLDAIADSISSATDAQYELVQGFFDVKGELKQPTDTLRVLSHEKLNDSEKNALAYIQDDICTQATIIKKTVAHLGDLFHKFSGSSVDNQSQIHSKHGTKKIKLEDKNKTRMETIYLRGEYETQMRQLRETEEKLKALSPKSHLEEISGRNPVGDAGQWSFEVCNKRITELEEILKQKEEEIHRMRNEYNDQLIYKTKSLKDDNEEHKRKIKKLSDDLYVSNQRKHRLEQDIRSLNRKIESLERDKNSKIATLEGDLYKLRRHNETRRTQKTMFLYTCRRSDLLNKVIAELKQMLELHFETQNMTLRIVDCENASEIEPNKPVLVLCINASRLGTDVSNALFGIQGNENVSVVVLHHKEIHALPNQSSERVLTSSEYKSLGGIIDMAFLSNKGIYSCDMNNTAMSSIVEFIKQRN